MANALGVDEAILDGMVTTADETGRPQFYDLLRHTRSPVYVAFDLIWVDGETCAPAARRARRQLQAILPKGSRLVSEPLSVTGKGRELLCARTTSKALSPSA